MMSDISATGVRYRERLSPSLWVLASAAVSAPMVALVFVKVDRTIALALGVIVAALVILVLVFASPVIRLADGELHVGRAHIPVELLGSPESLTGDAARHARGPGLSATSWHLLRGGVDGLVRVPVVDERDPVDAWVFSTRTPDRVVALIARAQQLQRA